MAGYSNTPLPKKLGIKVAAINPPPAFDKTLGELPSNEGFRQGSKTGI